MESVKPIKILNKIMTESHVNNSSKNIYNVFKEAFESNDPIELFYLRSLLIEQIDYVTEHTKKSDNTLQAFKDIKLALTYSYLDKNINQIKNLITPSHISALEQAFEIQDFKQNFDSMDDISKANDELKDIIETEEITNDEKKILLEICHDVEQAIHNHNILGNKAIKKLHESLLGKLISYGSLIKNIKSKAIKEKLGNLYYKIEKANKAMNTFTNLIDKVSEIINFLPSFS